MKKWIAFLFGLQIVWASDTVVDKETGLMWQDSRDIPELAWSEAKRYCHNLSLGSYSDWRLPHIDELMSVTDKGRYNPAIKKIFTHTKSSFYWSSSEVKSDTSHAWNVNFKNGNDYWSNKSYKSYVRCVRDSY